MPALTVHVNGEQRTVDADPSTLAKVMETLGHHPKLVVVELSLIHISEPTRRS